MPGGGISWRQIGVGFVVLGCIGLGTAAAALVPGGSSLAREPLRSMAAFAVLAALYGVWTLLRPGLARASIRLGPTPEAQLRLKRWAVAAMWLVSVLLSLSGLRLTQLVNPW